MLKGYFKKENLEKFFQSYSESVLYVLNSFNIKYSLSPDHLGCLLHSSEEFEEVSKILSTYSKLIKEIELHGWRVRVFKLNNPVGDKLKVPKIEIFEPKPDSDFSKLRYGVEHISFYIPNWEKFLSKYKDKIPVAKEGTVNSSHFLKTETINTIEIEFRSDKLGEELV